MKHPLNLLLLLGLLEVIGFHLYYWDFTSSIVLENLSETGFSSYRTQQSDSSSLNDYNYYAYSPKAPNIYPPFNVSMKQTALTPATLLAMGTNITQQKLIQMGVDSSEVDMEERQRTLPKWSDIVQNYGLEPVLLGLERCEAYRNSVPVRERIIAAAGLFSTGTNVLYDMLEQNCQPPRGKRGKFLMWQVPWGKHNPASARLQHAAPRMEHRNHTAVLPVVMIRHPYSWMHALCLHHYSLNWPHDELHCNETLALDQSVQGQFGAAKQTYYPSLVHVWRDWNLLYFEERSFPLLMVRHDDLIFRPEPVVQQVCECVGGSINTSVPFYYPSSSANRGHGHGDHRSSDLLSTWFKYGEPMSHYKQKYTAQDWNIIQSVLQDDHGMLQAFQYSQ
jgi:hypothetical protein